ncbi:MAG: FGGY-family carbohydrate kinase [Thermofilaceae archaeon]
MSREALIVVDFGSSALKVQAFTTSGEFIVERRAPLRLYADEATLTVEYNPTEVESSLFTCLRSVGEGLQRLQYEVKGIGCTSQRYNMVLLDINGRELCMSPNVDPRGFLASLSLSDDECAELYRVTGLYPPHLFTAARLIWFKEFKPESFSKISKILTICDWLLYKLCGAYTTCPSLAASTMLFDVVSMRWSRKAMEMFGVVEDMLPEIVREGDFAGYLSREAAEKTSLPEGLPVVVCGGDTQTAALAAGVFGEGEVGVIAGRTVPVVAWTGNPAIDAGMRTWLVPHVGGGWLVESNAGPLGEFVEWFLRDIIVAEDYGALDRLFELSEPGAKGVMMKLYPSIMDAKSLGRQSFRSFISTPLLASPFTQPVKVCDMVRALLEYVAYSIKANVLQAVSVASKRLTSVRATGGLTRIRSLRKLLPSVLGRTVFLTNVPHGSGAGSAALTAFSLGCYSSLREAARAFVLLEGCEPDPDLVEHYEAAYVSWLDFYTSV